MLVNHLVLECSLARRFALWFPEQMAMRSNLVRLQFCYDRMMYTDTSEVISSSKFGNEYDASVVAVTLQLLMFVLLRGLVTVYVYHNRFYLRVL
jgi:hypothetical protein